MKKILGISAFYHDSAAALIIDGEIIAAAQEERFTRIKHTAEFPHHAITYCLSESGLTIDDLDAVVFYDKPFLKFERLLETYYAFSPKGLISFLKAIPIWLKEKIFLKKLIRDGLKKVEAYEARKLSLLFCEHHLSHAASAYYPSPYSHAAILTIDGVGEWSTASIGLGDEAGITILKELNFPHSVGLLYSAFTYYLGFRVNSGEYKLMGLAPFGHPRSPEVNDFKKQITSELISMKDDGSIWLNQTYFQYATGLKMTNNKKWEHVFGMQKREPEEEITQRHCNLALAIQEITEEIVLRMAAEAKRLTGANYLCLAGGVALNCVANGKLLRSGLFNDIYIQPAAGDAGGSLGAALAIHHLYFDQPLQNLPNDSMKGSYVGPSFETGEILRMCKRTKATCTPFDTSDELTRKVATYLNDGNVVGWFQGRMEFGPRALGNRSILADPRNPDMQKKLNLKIKFREGFRPFAPAVTIEDCNDYFDLTTPSPYMLLVSQVGSNQLKPVPADYLLKDMKDRLYTPKSTLPAVTHVDFSARVQTVHKETNPLFHQLLNSFKALSGMPVLINTSFNVRGEPIVCTPFDAYSCFMASDMDVLVIEQFVFEKTAQPDWEDKTKWTKAFGVD